MDQSRLLTCQIQCKGRCERLKEQRQSHRRYANKREKMGDQETRRPDPTETGPNWVDLAFLTLSSSCPLTCTRNHEKPCPSRLS